ncbi:hypothetical protein MCUN1_000692 [Malassezia cuniculi]|uniref:Cyclin N-terminal domain-containing protein n=1 Tax=Malassezia cuniculi TaxID=948313 RepID=A0AAF0J5W5_9BASI|nr:hypothetical protein MCUN1_000692 [Malassezia cuniculi]
MSAQSMLPNHRHSFYGWHRSNSLKLSGITRRASQRVSTIGHMGPMNMQNASQPTPPVNGSRRSSLMVFNGLQQQPQPQRNPANILFETEYQEDTLEHMRHMEKQTMPTVELMDVQPELHWFMRPYLVDFLIEIHQTFRLRPETLYLTMNIVDRYVSKRIVYKRHYQLVGCAALLTAAKFEDSKDRVPTVQELSQMCCNAYDASAFTQMEGHVLSTIDWSIGHPTAEAWLRYEYATAPPANLITHSVARFLLEITLFHRDFVSTLPSALAAGAMMLARYMCQDPNPANPTPHARASSTAHHIHTFVAEHINDISLILIKKYSHNCFGNASSFVLDWFRKQAEMSRADHMCNARVRQDVFSSDDEGESVRSNSPALSIFSTPSRSITRDEDEDDSLPVTPLSLNINMNGDSSTGSVSRPPLPSGLSAKRTSQAYPYEVNKPSVVSLWGTNHLKPVAKHPKVPQSDMDVEMSHGG